MKIDHVHRHDITETRDGRIAVVVTTGGKRVTLYLEERAASDLAGGLHQFFEKWGRYVRARKAAKLKELAARGASKADLLEHAKSTAYQPVAITDAWVDRALAGDFDLPPGEDMDELVSNIPDL